MATLRKKLWDTHSLDTYEELNEAKLWPKEASCCKKYIIFFTRYGCVRLFCSVPVAHLTWLTTLSDWLTKTHITIPCCLCLRTLRMNWQKEWGDKSTSISDFDYIFCPFSEVSLLFWRLQCSSWSSETSILTWRPSSGAESLLRMNWWDWYSNCKKTTQVNLNMSCWKYKLWGKRKKTEWICLYPSWKNNTPPWSTTWDAKAVMLHIPVSISIS